MTPTAMQQGIMFYRLRRGLILAEYLNHRDTAAIQMRFFAVF